jgi:outer membrane beta-barrel protein
MRLKHLIAGLALMVGVMTLDGAVAMAQTSAEDGSITVIQPRPMLRRNRVDLSGSFGPTLNTPLYRQYVASGSLAFNISERISVGPTFEWFEFDDALGGKTADYEQFIADTDAIPGVAPLTWAGMLDVNLVPLYGKLVMFKKVIAYWDLEVLVAGGVITSGQDDTHPAAAIGVQGNLYFNRWLSLNLGVRDRISSEDYSGQSALTHTATAQLGLTMFVPFGFRYRTELSE